MLIEVLYVPGCPHYEPAIRRLRKILRAEAVEAAIEEIAIADELSACSLQFRGSPTIRINGLDAEPDDRKVVGMACRLYAGGSGIPSEEMLQRAVSAAKKSEGRT